MGRRIAVIVNSQTGPELSAGKQDASRIFSIFTRNDLGQCDPEKSMMLLDCSTKAVFMDGLDQILADWNSGDQLIFYFTGHGEIKNGRYSMLLGADKRGVIPFDSLLADLQVHGVSKAILILDACHSGAIVRGAKGPPFSTNNLSPDLPSGIALVASCRYLEKSYELPNDGGSLFSSLLSQCIETGMGGKPTANSLITIDDALSFISEKLRSDDFSAYPQSPVYSINGADTQLWLSRNVSVIEKVSPGGVQRSPIRSIEELRFLYERTSSSRHPCVGATIEQLDWEIVRDYAKSHHANLPTDKHESAQALGFYSALSEHELSNSSVLCFSKKPELHFPQARIIIVHGDKDNPLFAPVLITGPLSKQVTAAINYVSDIHRKSKVLLDPDLARLLDSVVREAISNAVAHRNYEHNAHIRITIKDYDVEILNPGVFPYGSRWEQILLEDFGSRPNDPAIAWYLTNLLSFEGVGRGSALFRKYLDATSDMGLECQQDSSIPAVKLTIRYPTPKIEAISKDSEGHTIYMQRSSTRELSRTPPTLAPDSNSQNSPISPPPNDRNVDRKALTEFDDSTVPYMEHSESHPIIHGYRIIREIGRGGMASVYQAEQTNLRRQVAIKVISSRYNSVELASRFKREGQILAKLLHPFIVTIFDMGFTDDFAYIVMEYVEGVSIDRFYSDHPEHSDARLREISNKFQQISEAVEFAHQHSIIHRDIKPSNILIRKDGSPCILDFGISRLTSSDFDQTDLNMTMTGVIMGTPTYMSPEQFHGDADVRSDVYSIGALLYEVLTQRKFRTGRNLSNLHNEAFNDTNQAPLSLLNSSVWNALMNICRTATQVQPENRYQSARDIGEALRIVTEVVPSKVTEVVPQKAPSTPSPNILQRFLSLWRKPK